MTQDYYSPKEVAAKLGLAKNTVFRLLHSGDIASNKIGGSVRVSRADLEAYLDRTRVPARGERGKLSGKETRR